MGDCSKTNYNKSNSKNNQVLSLQRGGMDTYAPGIETKIYGDCKVAAGFTDCCKTSCNQFNMANPSAYQTNCNQCEDMPRPSADVTQITADQVYAKCIDTDTTKFQACCAANFPTINCKYLATPQATGTNMASVMENIEGTCTTCSTYKDCCYKTCGDLTGDSTGVKCNCDRMYNSLTSDGQPCNSAVLATTNTDPSDPSSAVKNSDKGKGKGKGKNTKHGLSGLEMFGVGFGVLVLLVGLYFLINNMKSGKISDSTSASSSM